MNRLPEMEKLKAVYPQSEKWAARVEKMSDAQLFAILCRMKQQNKI